MNRLYRHGDLVLKRVAKSKIPKTAKLLKTSVLAEGETTGHKHQFSGGQVQLFADKPTSTEPAIVVVAAETKLIHDEHKPIAIEKGTYEVLHERELNPFHNVERRVVD